MKYPPNLWLDGSIVINSMQNVSALEYVYRASSDYLTFLLSVLLLFMLPPLHM